MSCLKPSTSCTLHRITKSSPTAAPSSPRKRDMPYHRIPKKVIEASLDAVASKPAIIYHRIRNQNAIDPTFLLSISYGKSKPGLSLRSILKFFDNVINPVLGKYCLHHECSIDNSVGKCRVSMYLRLAMVSVFGTRSIIERQRAIVKSG